MNPIQLFEPASSTYTYVLFDEDSRDALIIDPVDAQMQRDLGILRSYGLHLRYIVETHAHASLTLGLRHDAGAAEDAPRAVPAFAGYSGDVSPQLAYRWWKSGEAHLVDIRSHAERALVGFIPDVPGIEFKIWPGMAVNPEFDAQLKAAVPPGSKVLLLCRSGLRSIPAAQRAQTLGFEAYNILEGCEGDPDADAHRGNVGGWRKQGLPRRQN